MNRLEWLVAELAPGRRLGVSGVTVLLMLVVGAPTAASDSQALASGDGSQATSKESASGGEKAAAQTWYVQSRVKTSFGIVSVHYWSKGALFRAETMLAGHPVITFVSGPRYYVYDLILGTGAAIERNRSAVEEDAGRGRPFGRELDELIASGGEKVRDAALPEAGAGYEIYQLTNDNGRRRVSVTTSDPPLPFRVETFVRTSGNAGILEYSGWQRGLEIQDSFFEPPQTIRFERVSYEAYIGRVGRGPVGPAPVYYRDLLHGTRQE